MIETRRFSAHKYMVTVTAGTENMGTFVFTPQIKKQDEGLQREKHSKEEREKVVAQPGTSVQDAQT